MEESESNSNPIIFNKPQSGNLGLLLQSIEREFSPNNNSFEFYPSFR